MGKRPHGRRAGAATRSASAPDHARPAGRPRWPASTTTSHSRLSPRARKVWDGLAPNLVERRVLTAWDVDLFGAFCAVVVHLDGHQRGPPTGH